MSRDALIGTLVGIARATDGNDHLITPEVTEFLRQALIACRPDSGVDDGALTQLQKRAVAVKREMVPNCFLCDNPCGRTSDFDMASLTLEPPQVRERKQYLLQLAQRSAENSSAALLLYDALYLIGMEMDTVDYLLPTIEKLKNDIK